MNKINNAPKHIPVMLDETIKSINFHDGMSLIDVTLGGGGHSKNIIQKALDNKFTLNLLTLDQDYSATKVFSEWLLENGFSKENEKFQKDKVSVLIETANFKDLRLVLKKNKIKRVDAIIADLGFSTDQLENFERGFSFLGEGNLDMRMSMEMHGVKASDLLNVLSLNQLIELFKKFGDLTWEAKKIASEVVNYRKSKRIEKVSDLLQIIKKALNFKSSRHVEARVFQAIRIQVNQEIDALESFLPQSLEALVPQGVVSIITFHSGEDRVVKHYFKKQEQRGRGEALRIKPTEEEIKKNSKSSSAKLRVFKKNV